MANCSPDEKDISNQKLGAKFGLSIITIIYVIFIIFIIFVILSIKRRSNNQSEPIKKPRRNFLRQVIDLLPKKENFQDHFLDRFSDWFTKMGSSINYSSVLAILAAGLVLGFNSLVMTPLIQTMFPIDITQNMEIPGRDVIINPGQFLVALIGFVLSLILFYFIAEIFGLIHKYAKTGLIVLSLVLLFAFLTTMLGINIHIASQILPMKDCVAYNTNIPSFQIRSSGSSSNNGSSSSSKIPVKTPSFGVFG